MVLCLRTVMLPCSHGQNDQVLVRASLETPQSMPFPDRVEREYKPKEAQSESLVGQPGETSSNGYTSKDRATPDLPRVSATAMSHLNIWHLFPSMQV